MDGFFKHPFSMLSWKFRKDPVAYSVFAFFLESASTSVYHFKKFTIRPGECIANANKIAKATGIYRCKVQVAVDTLIKSGEVKARKLSCKDTIFTVKNYSELFSMINNSNPEHVANATHQNVTNELEHVANTTHPLNSTNPEHVANTTHETKRNTIFEKNQHNPTESVTQVTDLKCVNDLKSVTQVTDLTQGQNVTQGEFNAFDISINNQDISKDISTKNKKEIVLYKYNTPKEKNKKINTEPVPEPMPIFDFDAFWIAYAKKVDKRKCQIAFSHLTVSDKKRITQTLADYIIAHPEPQFRKNPLTYLHGHCWEDDLSTLIATNQPPINQPHPETPKNSADPQCPVCNGSGIAALVKDGIHCVPSSEFNFPFPANLSIKNDSCFCCSNTSAFFCWKNTDALNFVEKCRSMLSKPLKP